MSTPQKSRFPRLRRVASVGGELSLAEARRRTRELVMTLLVGIAIIALVVFGHRFSGLAAAAEISSSGLFLFLNALTLILIILLVFLIGRAMVKLLFERRRGILGSHLHVKFVSAFVLIAVVPTAVLFVVSAVFMNASINTWFSLQVDQALDQSRQVADRFYESAADEALFFGRRIAEEITERRLLREENLSELSNFIQQKQRDYNLGVVEVFSSTGEELSVAINPEIPAANFSRPDSDLVQAALEGVSASRAERQGKGDVLRGAVPIVSSFRSDETVGVIVVNSFIPDSLTRKVDSIRAALDDYRAVQPNADHIRSAYLLQLMLVFLVLLLLATWWGFRMAKGVTGPIGNLAEGTAEVARGNLDVVVEATSDDEIGFLVHSFNKMTRDLREARGGLERSNSELDQRRRYMEIVLRNTGAGVISMDAMGVVSTMNPSAQRLLGIPAGTPVVGQKIEDVLNQPEHLDLVRELSAKLRVDVRETIRRQVQVPLRDEVLTLLVTVTLLKDEEGRALGVVVVFDDYSQLVKAQRMSAWQEVARRIAHEIKNPLTPIQLSAQRIRRRFRSRLGRKAEDSQVFDECVDTILSQVEGLKILVNEFSNFARLPTANPKPEDLNKLVKEAVASYAAAEGVVLESEIHELPVADLDREHIRRVLTNLIDNAIAAVQERALEEADFVDARVIVKTSYDEGRQIVQLEVADNGVGIPAMDRTRIFEPYFSTKEHGTGLGLPIVARIVADHHGYLRVHENPPRGARVILELPVRST